MSRWFRRGCSSQRLKTIYRLEQAIVHLCPEDQLSCAGMLQLRFEDDVDLKVARGCFGKITDVLGKVFTHYCGVFEFGPKGSVHVHTYFVAPQDVLSGFNKFAYREFCALKRERRLSWMSEKDYAQELRDLPEHFTPNENLEGIRTRLNKLAPQRWDVDSAF